MSAAATLQVVERVDELRTALAPARASGASIGFVPTMGALHEGHAELLRTARTECDVVVASCYVNPLQFGAGDDLDRYPRSPDADAALVAAAGADLLWRPDTGDVYGVAGEASPRLDAGPMGRVLEGASRPGHFDGVVTVVARLLGAVEPDRLYLGEKDFQQLAVLRELVRDMGVPVEVCAVPTARASDGLALSSRNAYLSAEERLSARAIARSLRAAAGAVEDGARDAPTIRAAALAVLDAEHGIDLDYLALVDVATLAFLTSLDTEAVLLVAARVGSTRLIDNVRLSPGESPGTAPTEDAA